MIEQLSFIEEERKYVLKFLFSFKILLLICLTMLFQKDIIFVVDKRFLVKNTFVACPYYYI